jgi:tetratricopeptide (TPR) repeat protein
MLILFLMTVFGCVKDPAADLARIDNKTLYALPDMTAIEKIIRPELVSVSLNPSGQYLVTGFALNEDGWVVTDYQSIKLAKKIMIQNNSGFNYSVSEPDSLDPHSGLALIHVQDEAFRVKGLPLFEDVVHVKDKVVFVSYEDALYLRVNQTIVSGKEKLDSGLEVYWLAEGLYVAGAPVFNEKGNLIGISSFLMKDKKRHYYVTPVGHVIAFFRRVQGGATVAVATSGQDAYQKGTTFFEADDFHRAAAYFEEAVKLEPMNADYLFDLALAYREISDKRAVEILQRALSVNPEIEDGHYELGVTCNQFKLYDEAEKAFANAVKADYQDQEALGELVELYRKRKGFDDTIKLLNGRHGLGGDLLVGLGEAYYFKNDFESALHTFSSVIEAVTDHIPAYLGLGMVHVRLENWAHGIKVMNRAQALDPENPKILFLLSLINLIADDEASAQKYRLGLDDLKQRAMQQPSGSINLVIASRYADELNRIFVEYQKNKDMLTIQKGIEADNKKIWVNMLRPRFTD